MSEGGGSGARRAAAALSRPSRPAARALPQSGRRGAPRLRAARAGPVPRHAAPRREAARQGAAAPLRLLRRGDRGAARAPASRSKASARGPRPSSRSSRPRRGASPRARSPSGRCSAPGARCIDYCRTAMAFAEKESFRILFLDKRNGLIADEVQQTGTVDHTPVYPREVVKRALELSATALILVHNHPSGDPRPSTADIRVTQEIAKVASPLGIAGSRPHHRRPQRACELEGDEAVLASFANWRDLKLACTRTGFCALQTRAITAFTTARMKPKLSARPSAPKSAAKAMITPSRSTRARPMRQVEIPMGIWPMRGAAQTRPIETTKQQKPRPAQLPGRRHEAQAVAREALELAQHGRGAREHRVELVVLNRGGKRAARQPRMTAPPDDLQGDDDEEEAADEGDRRRQRQHIRKAEHHHQEREAAVAERSDDLAKRDPHTVSIGCNLVQDVGGVTGEVHARAGFRKVFDADEMARPRRPGGSSRSWRKAKAFARWPLYDGLGLSLQISR